MSTIALSLLPFVLLEAVLGLSGVGSPDESNDPFVGFAKVIPLFELNANGDRYEIAQNRLTFFAPDGFSAEKTDNTFRVFCLGGSTVQGRPYSIETSFTTWLRIALQHAHPEVNWEIVNCGGISYASYRLVPILEECLGHQPDLIILCTGHNEFLEDRSYRNIKQIPGMLAGPAQLLLRSRTVMLARSLVAREASSKAQLTTEVDAMLDYKDGIRAFHRDDVWASKITEHFRFNLRRMIEMANRHHVPMLVMQPVSNLSGTAPFKWESDLAGQQAEFTATLRTSARSHYRDDTNLAIEQWQQVCQNDPRNAMDWYELGRCLEAQQRYHEARDAFIKSRDEDIVPLRMTSHLETAMSEVVREKDVPYLNLQQFFQDQSPTGIVGDNWLVDHVHPSFEGHQQIAIQIGRWMQAQHFVAFPANWEEQSQFAFNTYFDSIDRNYFHRGQRMLDALELWTQGHADGPPIESRFPERMREESSELPH